MISHILFFAIISSGSFFCATAFKRRYEELLPITCSGMVLLLFLFGYLKQLQVGVLTVISISVLLYIIAFIMLLIRKNYKDSFHCFFSGGFFVFFVLYLLISYLNYGRMCYRWDEFSHWGDIVKAMCQVNDFGTNTNSHSAFQSYPPGMALFQYFLVKLDMAVKKKYIFDDWRLYFVYQIYISTFIMPFLKKLCSQKKVIATIFSVIILCITPISFFGNIYFSIYIDPIISIIFGVGMAMIFLWDDKDIYYSIYLLLSCFMLVLMKDAGFLFACFLAFAYSTDRVINIKKLRFINIVKEYGIALLAVVIPKALWKHELHTSGAHVSFSDSLNMKELCKILFSGQQCYQKEVVKNYIQAMISKSLVIENINVSVPYAVLLFFMIVVLLALLHYYNKNVTQNQKNRKMVVYVMIGLFFVYIIGLCFTYVLNFTEYEALKLASFERYINIVFLSGWILITNIIVFTIVERKDWIPYYILMFAFVMVITPIQTLESLIYRQDVKVSIETRGRYCALNTIIEEITEGKPSNIYFIAQEETGYSFLATKYSIRPNTVNENISWSIGEEPFYEGDIYTKSKSVLEWQEELRNNFDYVILYTLNDYFRQTYFPLFKDMNDIEEMGIYKVNKKSGMLERCIY